MSRQLFQQLLTLVQKVLYAKGVKDSHLHAEICSAFCEKLLKFKSLFYTKLQLYSEAQTRSFLAMTVRSVLLDHYRKENQQRTHSLDALPNPDNFLPETSWQHFKLEAYGLYEKCWKKLDQELRELFCLLYDEAKTLEHLAAERQQSLGKIHKDKKRISQLIAPEASVEEVAQMIYRLMVLEFCCAA